MTDIELRELLAKAKAATPGPYHIGHLDEDGDEAEIDTTRGITIANVHNRKDQPYFCAMSPDVAIKLIEELLAWRDSSRR